MEFINASSHINLNSFRFIYNIIRELMVKIWIKKYLSLIK
jgi:hypothetical protein